MFNFFSFLGNFSRICCLRDWDSEYLRETKDMAKMGERGAAGCSLLAGGLSLWMCRDTMRVWLGLSLALSHSWDQKGHGWAAAVGRIHCQCSVLWCTAFLTMGEPLFIRAAGELGPFQHPISLRRTLTIYSGAPGKNPAP